MILPILIMVTIIIMMIKRLLKIIIIAGVSSRPQAGALLTRLSFSAHKCHFSGLISKKGSCLGLPYESEHAKIQRTPKRSMCKCFKHIKWISHSKSVQMFPAHQMDFTQQKQVFGRLEMVGSAGVYQHSLFVTSSGDHNLTAQTALPSLRNRSHIVHILKTEPPVLKGH